MLQAPIGRVENIYVFIPCIQGTLSPSTACKKYENETAKNTSKTNIIFISDHLCHFLGKHAQSVHKSDLCKFNSWTCTDLSF